MSTGTVKWFNSSKGFGFITPDDGGEDLFVHQTEIKSEGFRTLQEGEKVGYEPIEDKGKMKAVNVTSTDGGAVKGGSGGGGGRGRGGGRQQPRKWPEGVSPSDGKQIGAVKWFNSEKGYGFIAPAAAGEDLFVHQSAINAAGFRSLMEGEEVRAAPHRTPRRRARRAAARTRSPALARSLPRRSSSRSSRRTARRRRSMSRGPTATSSRAPRAVAAAAAATRRAAARRRGRCWRRARDDSRARRPPLASPLHYPAGRTLHLLIVSHHELPI